MKATIEEVIEMNERFGMEFVIEDGMLKGAFIRAK